jgi:hypothetical protein
VLEWPRRRRRPPVEIGRDEHTRGRKGGEADTVVCSAWPTTEPSVRTAAWTRALLAVVMATAAAFARGEAKRSQGRGRGGERRSGDALAVAIWRVVVASSGTAMAELELAAAIHGSSGHGGALKRGKERRRASNGGHRASRNGSVSMTREEEVGHAASARTHVGSVGCAALHGRHGGHTSNTLRATW